MIKSIPNILRCECCGVPWDKHDNALQICKRANELKNENQKLKEELKTLRNKLVMSAGLLFI